MEHNIGLIKGRHTMPEKVSGYVYEALTADSITNPEKLETMASYGLDSFKIKSGDIVNLYVTGLTVALVATLNVLQTKYKVNTVLWHYNIEDGAYFAQRLKRNN